MPALGVKITGRVQGVSFRAWAADQARALGLSGWVRNEADGSVSGLVAGDDAAVSRMVRLLEEGPPAARVTAVETWPAEMPSEAEFRILV